MRKSRYNSGASAKPYRRTAAPRVREQHSRKCGLSTGSGGRCSCRPSFVACVRSNGRPFERSFPSLGEAVSWAEATRDAIRRGEAPTVRVHETPPLRDLAISFLHRAKRGEALTRSRQRYSVNTLTGYEAALRLRVLPHIDPRTTLELGDVNADAIDTRIAQSLVDAITVRDGHARARAAAAALAAVLRDGYVRGLIDQLPPRLLLPPPPSARTRALTFDEADALLTAARADDQRRCRSLLAPFVSLLLGTGCRVSEATGLLWGSEGLELAPGTAVMHIRRETTKTAAGVRTIPLDEATGRELREHQLASGRPADGTHVFTRAPGVAVDRSGRLRVGLVRVAAAAGIERVSAHVLRHTHATWLAAAGVPPPVAAARLGHADGGALFMRVYAHTGAADAASAIAALSEYRRFRSGEGLRGARTGCS